MTGIGIACSRLALRVSGGGVGIQGVLELSPCRAKSRGGSSETCPCLRLLRDASFQAVEGGEGFGAVDVMTGTFDVLPEKLYVGGGHRSPSNAARARATLI